MTVPLTYDQPVFRPPSEAHSLILQTTIGCSHNECTFCSMYRSKRFRVKSRDEVRAEIEEAKTALGDGVRRVFLGDGDAMCLPAPRLIETLDAVGSAFPRLQRVGIYANARDVLRKSHDELVALRERRLKIVYMGLESGDEETLADIEKGATAAEIVEAVRKAQRAGMSASVMVLVGLAGAERSLEHARRSAEAVNAMAPAFTALLTYTPTPSSPLADRVARGKFRLPSPIESLREIRAFVRGVTCETYFTCNHASNYVPLVGRLPGSKPDILAALDAAIAGELPLKPEFLRGL